MQFAAMTQAKYYKSKDSNIFITLVELEALNTALNYSRNGLSTVNEMLHDIEGVSSIPTSIFFHHNSFPLFPCNHDRFLQLQPFLKEAIDGCVNCKW